MFLLNKNFLRMIQKSYKQFLFFLKKHFPMLGTYSLCAYPSLEKDHFPGLDNNHRYVAICLSFGLHWKANTFWGWVPVKQIRD